MKTIQESIKEYITLVNHYTSITNTTHEEKQRIATHLHELEQNIDKELNK